MTTELGIAMDRGPEASGEAAYFMDVARAVFERFTSEWPEQPIISAEQLAVAKIGGARFPLYVIGEARKFVSGVISIHPNSRPDKVVISSFSERAWGGSVVAHFINANKFSSSLGSLSNRCFEAFHLTDPDGTGGGGQGSIAVVKNGVLENARWLTGKTIKAYVVFAGINGLLPRKIDHYHGFVVID